MFNGGRSVLLFVAKPTQCDESSEFSCGDGTCIDRHLLCDDRYDCPDGRDERDCGES